MWDALAPYGLAAPRLMKARARNMAKTAAKLFGLFMLLLSLIGSASPNFFGLHLGLFHNLLNLITALTGLYFGFAATLPAARLYCFILGLFYGLLGFYGFLLGGYDRMFEALSGSGLYLGTMDHVLHLLLSLFMLAGAFLTRTDWSHYSWEHKAELNDPSDEPSVAVKHEPRDEELRDSRPEPTPTLPAYLAETITKPEDFATPVKPSGASKPAAQPIVNPDSASEDPAYDVFISYRRGDASSSARLIRGELRSFHLRVFLDVDDLRAGYFDEALLRHIENTPNFVVILSPGSLARCADENDWFRQEVAHALKTGKNIVPILMPGFEFPPKELLPEDISQLRVYQSVPYSHEFFDAMMNKLRGYLRY